MRATAAARVPVSSFLMLAALPMLLAFVSYRVHVGNVDGDVGPDGVDICMTDPVEAEELGLELDVANLCLRMDFCTGFGVDSMSQEFCPPID